jgi:predicted MPP superfamily phosphohydrolase
MRKMVTDEKNKHYGWLTDIHLEFSTNKEAAAFVRHLTLKGLDGLFVTGDISTANQIEGHLQLFEELYKAPVYFVLGNHDYYGGEIESVRSNVQKVCRRSRWLHWLPASGVVPLNDNTCLIGHDGWADGRLGNYKGSKVLLNDYLKIQNFVQAGDVGRLALLNSLGDQAASYIQEILPIALKQYNHIMVLTHVPPFMSWQLHKINR